MTKSLLQQYQAGWPPPPHDPRERCYAGNIGQWEVRVFSRQDVKYQYFALKGFLHLQLWHPVRQLSLLTPSLLTDNHYEIFPVRNWKFRVCCFNSVNEVLRHHLEASPIDPLVLRFMEDHFVVAESQSAQAERPSNNHKVSKKQGSNN